MGQGRSGATWERPRGLLDGSNSLYLYPGQLWLVNYPPTPTNGRLAAQSWYQRESGATWERHRGLLDGSNGPYISPGQLWLVNDPVTPTMAAWQPDLGAKEGLEPLGSNLEGC